MWDRRTEDNEARREDGSICNFDCHGGRIVDTGCLWALEQNSRPVVGSTLSGILRLVGQRTHATAWSVVFFAVDFASMTVLSANISL